MWAKIGSPSKRCKLGRDQAAQIRLKARYVRCFDVQARQPLSAKAKEAFLSAQTHDGLEDFAGGTPHFGAVRLTGSHDDLVDDCPEPECLAPVSAQKLQDGQFPVVVGCVFFPAQF